jgi:acyl-CoA reductase-like NAD-dependent aldehyde dehydrogenase
MDFNNDYTMTINGKAASSQETINVINPATGKAFAQAPDVTDAQLDEAVAAAQEAFKSWKRTPIEERQALMKKAGDAISANVKELAALFCREQGRPVDLAAEEIGGAAAWCFTYAQMTPPVQVAEDSDERRVETSYVPLGVVCAISPWNYPVLLSTWKLAPAIVAGNTVVLKPSPFTPLCMLKIGELLRDVFPPGVLNIITGNDTLGPKMTSHPAFDKISFTGSTATGKRVMESAAKDLKRLTLELGGNDAAIVLPDVDVDEVAEKIFFGSFANTAQICVATKRLYVHEDVYDALRDRLIAISQNVKVGNGAEEGTVLERLELSQTSAEISRFGPLPPSFPNSFAPF